MECVFSKCELRVFDFTSLAPLSFSIVLWSRPWCLHSTYSEIFVVAAGISVLLSVAWFSDRPNRELI